MQQAMVLPKQYFFDKNNNPLAFGKVYTKLRGTDTDQPTFSDQAGTIANSNPVILNGEGYAAIYIRGDLTLIVDDVNDANIWTANISSNVAEEWVDCLIPTFIDTVSFKVSGDVTNSYTLGRAVQINNSVPTLAYSNISEVSFAAGETTITVATPVVLPGIKEVCRSIISLNSTPTTEEILNGKLFGIISGQDVTAAFQSLLDAAKGREAYIGAGDYDLSAPLLIDSDTRLRMHSDASFTKIAPMNVMLRNRSDGLIGGFAAGDNILISGGTWDVNNINFPEDCTTMAFSHCTRVEVEGGRYIRNGLEGNAIHFNACQKARAFNNAFFDGGNNSIDGEMIQISHAGGASIFPFFGPYDDTPCLDIEVDSNRANLWAVCVGSHHVKAGVIHTEINVHDNAFNPLEGGVIAKNWSDSRINNNGIKCPTGKKALQTSGCVDMTITANVGSGDISHDAGVGTSSDIVFTGNRIKGDHALAADTTESLFSNNSFESVSGVVDASTHRGENMVGGVYT